MDIVINYDSQTKEYKIYEPTTNSMIISMNLTEGLVNLNLFLKYYRMHHRFVIKHHLHEIISYNPFIIYKKRK